jgi:hypothetical protein
MLGLGLEGRSNRWPPPARSVGCWSQRRIGERATSDSQGERWLLSYSPQELSGDARWHIDLVVPESQLTGPAQGILMPTAPLSAQVIAQRFDPM